MATRGSSVADSANEIAGPRGRREGGGVTAPLCPAEPRHALVTTPRGVPDGVHEPERHAVRDERGSPRRATERASR